jgi:hypothetical protein
VVDGQVIRQKNCVVCVLVPLSQVTLMFQWSNLGMAGTILRSVDPLASSRKLRLKPSAS